MCYSQATGFRVTIFKSGILFLFGNSTLREIIHLRVSAYKHEFKAFERTPHSRETLVTVESRIIPNSWSAPKLIKKERSHWKSHLFKPSGLFSVFLWLSFSFHRHVNPGATCLDWWSRILPKDGGGCSCCVSPHLCGAWIESSPSLGWLDRGRETDQGFLTSWTDQSFWWEIQLSERTTPPHPSNSLGDTGGRVLFPSQRQSRGEALTKRGLLVRPPSNGPQHWLLLFPVDSILKSWVGGQDPVSDEVYTQGAGPCSLAPFWLVRKIWESPLPGDARAVFVIWDSKSEGWEEVGNSSLESHNQSVEGTRSIQDPLQVTGM